nr:MAG TPA: hypothetical protein [Caudoviricetes sp.]
MRYCVTLLSNHSILFVSTFTLITYLNINHMIIPMKINHAINAFQSNLCFVILKFTFIFYHRMLQFGKGVRLFAPLDFPLDCEEY